MRNEREKRGGGGGLREIRMRKGGGEKIRMRTYKILKMWKGREKDGQTFRR